MLPVPSGREMLRVNRRMDTGWTDYVSELSGMAFASRLAGVGCSCLAGLYPGESDRAFENFFVYLGSEGLLPLISYFTCKLFVIPGFRRLRRYSKKQKNLSLTFLYICMSV